MTLYRVTATMHGKRIATSKTFATKAEAQNFEIGIRYNPEFTGLLNRNDMNAGSELMPTSNFVYSGSFGAGVIFNFSRNYGLALDILFSREGQRFKGYLASSPSDAAAYSSVVRLQAFQNNIVIVGDYVAKAELNYIKIPLTMSFSSDNSKPFFFTMLVGPQFNILKGVAQEVNHEDLEYPNSNITPYDLYKPITFDGILALGGAYNLSKHIVLSARIRLDYGFEDVENKQILGLELTKENIEMIYLMIDAGESHGAVFNRLKFEDMKCLNLR